MVLPASARYGIDAAPDGLDVVQDLLNTSPAGRDDPTTDLLGDLTLARRWTHAVAPASTVTTRELGRLRALRTALRHAVHERDGLGDTSPEPFAAAVGLRLDADGTVDGDRAGVVEAVLLRVYAAQERGDWPRLKLCALDVCDLAFFDRTRNTSARYHTPRCANLVNLHNSRLRRRRV